MKPQIQLNIRYMMIPALVGIIFFMSCKNDIEVVRRITSIETFPTLEAETVTILRSDSGKVIMKIITPMIRQFAQASEPYTEFPKGLNAVFMDKDQQVNTRISADEVIFYETDEKWEARYNVEVTDRDGRIINTEYMVFDQKKGKIFSNQFTKLTEDDAVIYGTGFESDPNLTNARIFEPTGDFYVDDKQK